MRKKKCRTSLLLFISFFVYGGNCPGGIFSAKLCHFFQLWAYELLLHCDTFFLIGCPGQSCLRDSGKLGFGPAISGQPPKAKFFIGVGRQNESGIMRYVSPLSRRLISIIYFYLYSFYLYIHIHFNMELYSALGKGAQKKGKKANKC